MFLAWQLPSAKPFFGAKFASATRELQTSEVGLSTQKSNGHQHGNYEEVLVKARLRLEEFIRLVGAVALQPLDLTKYQLDFPGENDFDFVDLDNIKEAVDSSIRKMMSNKKIKTNWSRDDLLVLLWIIEHYNRLNGKRCQQYGSWDWETVGSLVPGKNGQQAMFKWLSLKSNRMPERRDWEFWEDECLSRLVRENNQKKWFKISKELYLQTENSRKRYRSAKQCRERWTCYLNPALKKGNWSLQEDYILFGQFLKIGKKWSVITKQLRGRTENAVKNRWKLVVEKYEKHKKNQVHLRDYFEEYLRSLEEQMARSTKPSIVTSARTIEADDSDDESYQGRKTQSNAGNTSAGQDQEQFHEGGLALQPILELPVVDHFPQVSELPESDFNSLDWSTASRKASVAPFYKPNSASEVDQDDYQIDEEQSIPYFITNHKRHSAFDLDL